MTTSDGASGQPMADPDPAGSGDPPAEGRAEPMLRASSAATRAQSRTLQLVPPRPDPAASPGRHPGSIELDSQLRSSDQPQALPDLALIAANRLLERELAEVQEEVGALEELLEELPAIFERKFQQRLVAVLEERRRLEIDNHALRSRLRALAPGAAEVALERPRGLLPPVGRGSALRLERQRAGPGGEAGGSDPPPGSAMPG